MQQSKQDIKRRRLLLARLSSIGLLAGAGVSGLIRDALAKDKNAHLSGMRKVSGQVTVNNMPARMGMQVGAGDIIITGPGSTAIYVIGKDAYLQREQSSVSFASSALGATVSSMRVITGRILAVFGKGNKELQTGTATIGIRGTACYIEIEETRTYFCLCYGIAEVVPLSDPSRAERIVTKQHDRPVYIAQGSGDQAIVPAQVINHTNVELELLESLVGRELPFAKGNRYDFGY